MNIKRGVYTAAAGLLGACMAAATASAQDFIEYAYGNSAGAVHSVSVANLRTDWVATGVTNSAGNLELIVWASNGIEGTQLLRKGSATDTALGNLGSAPVTTLALTSKYVITAVVLNGTVIFVPWSVSSTGAVTPGMWVNAAFGTSARMAQIDSTHFLLAVVDGQGALSLSTWVATSTELNELSQITGAAATYASVIAVSTQYVTAIRTTAGDLQLDSWLVSESYGISHQSIISAGGISQVDMAVWSWGVATVVRNSLGDLEVIDWFVDAVDGTFTRGESAKLGAVSHVAASTISGDLFTASVNSTGDVDTGIWASNGVQLTEGASASEEAATLVSAAPLSSLYTVTAARTAAGNLQVDVWFGEYVP